MSPNKLAPQQSRKSGFTLIELMIAVAIVAILASIALPAYQNSVRKSRRADAMTSLLQLQLAQEKWRANNASYSTTLGNLGWSSSDSTDGHYTMAIASATGTQFSVTATPNSGGPQASDSCGVFTITQNGPDVSTSAKRSCWNR